MHFLFAGRWSSGVAIGFWMVSVVCSSRIAAPSSQTISMIASTSVTNVDLNLGSRNDATSSSRATSELVFLCDRSAMIAARLLYY